MDLEYDYYVIQMNDESFNGECVVVPKGWIKLSDLKESGDVVLKYPPKSSPGTERRVKDKEECMNDWKFFPGNAKYGSNSYEDATDYIRRYATASDLEGVEPPVKRKKISESEKHETPSEETDKEINEMQIIHVQPTEEPRKSEYDIIEESIRLLHEGGAPKTTHRNIANTLVTEVTTERVNRKNDVVNLALYLSNNITPKKVLGENCILVLNKMYSEYKKSCDTLEILHRAYIEKCSMTKKMIDLITFYKKQAKCKPKQVNNIVPVGICKTQTQHKEDCQIKIKTEEKYVTEKRSKVPEKQQKQIEVVNNVMGIEGEMINTNGVQSAYKSNLLDDRLKKLQTQEIILPPDQSKDDPRLLMKKVLVEPAKHTGVSADAVKLATFKVKFNQDSKTSAKNIADEVFSNEDLTTCSLREEKAGILKDTPLVPDLDVPALKAILNYVYEHSAEKNTTDLANKIDNKSPEK